MKEHGEFAIHFRDRTVYMRARDSWNEETTRAYISRLLQDVTEHFTSPGWAILADIRDWGLYTIDSVRQVDEYVRRLDELGRTHAAFVAASPLQEETVLEHMKPKTQTAEYRFFQTVEEAEQWLVSCGMLTPD